MRIILVNNATPTDPMIKYPDCARKSGTRQVTVRRVECYALWTGRS